MMERNTVQKQIIMDTVRQMHSHPSAVDVFLCVQKTHPSISKSTVYRVLRELAGKREIVPVAPPRDVERYDGNTRQHYHFRCKVCGGIFDVDTDVITALEAVVAKNHGHNVEYHEVFFWGKCKICIGNGSKA